MDRACRRLALAALAAAPLLLLAPREAGAFVRFHVGTGAQYVEPAVPLQSPTLVTGVLRGELTVGVLPWLHLGGYAEAFADFGVGNLGAGYGGMVAVRPHIPFSPIDPMGFVGLGYVDYPVGGGSHARSEALEGQIGAGVVLHAMRFLDFEARAAYARMFLRTPSSLGANGVTGTLGVALHF